MAANPRAHASLRKLELGLGLWEHNFEDRFVAAGQLEGNDRCAFRLVPWEG